MSEMKGTIFNVQHFSIYDGPGLRTTIFFKGCNLKCLWCHNPESIDPKIQLQYMQDLCIGCNRCQQQCIHGAISSEHGQIRLDHTKCTGCLRCTETCYSKALSPIGKEVTAMELFQEIKTNLLYYRNCKSGGGVTFSGGECMLQPAFLVEILRYCKEEGIHTAVDTAGNVPYEYFKKVNPYTDLYLYDIKAFDNTLHQKLTGVSNVRIRKNLELLLCDDKEIAVRIPVIPEGNAHELKKIAAYLKGFDITEVSLLPYHNMGLSKENRIGKTSSPSVFTEPTDLLMEEYRDLFRAEGITSIK